MTFIRRLMEIKEAQYLMESQMLREITAINDKVMGILLILKGGVKDGKNKN